MDKKGDTSYYLSHNGLVHGDFKTEHEAEQYGKTVTKKDWNENKLVEVVYYGTGKKRNSV